MLFKSLVITIMTSLFLFDKTLGAVTNNEPREIVYREIGGDGQPAEQKTLTLWNYSRPTNLPQQYEDQMIPVQDEHSIPREEFYPSQEEYPTKEEEQQIYEEESCQTWNNYDNNDTQIVIATATENDDHFMEETFTTVIDPPTIIEDIDDQFTDTVTVIETLYSTKTITLNTVTTTRTVIQGDKNNNVVLQSSLTGTFSIASNDLLFRANQGQKHFMDSSLYVAVAAAVIVGIF